MLHKVTDGNKTFRSEALREKSYKFIAQTCKALCIFIRKLWPPDLSTEIQPIFFQQI